MKNKLNILSIISIIVSFTLLVILYFFNILPFKYYLVGVLFMIFLNVISVLIVNRKSKALKVVGVLLLICTLTINGFGIYFVNNTNRLLNNINVLTEKSVYYVVVNKDSNYKNIKDLNNKTISLIKDEKDNYKKIINILEKDIKFNGNYYDNLPNMYNDLLSNNIDSIIINSSTYDIICEYNLNFKESTKIIDKISMKIKKQEEKIEKVSESFNILISGIDTKGNISNVSRSDVNIIVTINPRTHEILFTTIPRDTEVRLHGTTGLTDKLTHAGIYGIDMSRQTIEDFLNTKIDYYIRVNFDTLTNVVDSIGGVIINNDIAFNGHTRYFPQGNIHLNGREALEYSRERKKMPNGDYTRGLHQVEVLKGIINKITTSPEILKNYSKFVDTLGGFVQTNISDDIFKSFIKEQLNYSPSWTFNVQAVEGDGNLQETYSMPGMNLYVSIPNETSRLACSEAINNTLNRQ